MTEHSVKITFSQSNNLNKGFLVGYQLHVETESTNPVAVPHELLVIKRVMHGSSAVDRFFGLAKPADFSELGKNEPRPKHSFYLAKEWVLDFPNLEALEDTKQLLRSAISDLVLTLKANQELNEVEEFTATYTIG